MNNKKIDFSGRGMKLLLALIGLGGLLIVVRFIFGLGSVSNLSDGYPWGLWIGVDVLTGVALAAGGFTIAAAVHVLGLKKYHSVIRPAILTALLGYIFVALGIIVDLGRGWNIWHIIVFWNRDSVMFEVAWCVLLYSTVLALEFAPVFFEEFKLTAWEEKWDKYAPWISILLVSWFVFVMSGIPWYAGITFIILAACWFLFRNKLPRGSTVILLIMAGIIFSVQHQSSLGSIFLIVPTKLSTLWYTPYLPVNFLISAITVGLAMVIFESTISSRVFGVGLEDDVVKGLARVLPWAVLATAVVRAATLFQATGFKLDASGGQLASFFLEIIVGTVIPFIMLMFMGAGKSAKIIFYASAMVVIGVVINRINVSIVGIKIDGYPVYVPHIGEILITLGIISTGLLAFYIVCIKLPVFGKR